MKKMFKAIRNRMLSPVMSDLAHLSAQVEKLSTNQTGCRIDEDCCLYMDAATTKRILADRIAAGDMPDYEEILRQQYTKLIRPGNFVIDIGAHEGKHLSAFISLVGKKGGVLAVEPLAAQFNALVERFSFPNVEIINKALSDLPGMMPFYENTDYPEESGLKKRIYNNEGGTVVEKEIEVTTLDILSGSFSGLDYIKLDAEGAEIAILNGGVNTINKFRPVISVEYGHPAYSVYGYTADSLYDFRESVNYHITDIYGNVIYGRDMWHKLCDSVYWDFFIVPEEKIELFLTSIHTF